MDKEFEACCEQLRIDPHNERALIHRAGLLYNQGQFQAALKDYNTLTELFPSNSQYHSHKAQVYEVLGRVDDAEHSYAVACSLDPSNKEAHFKAGCLLAAKDEQMAFETGGKDYYERLICKDLSSYTKQSKTANRIERMKFELDKHIGNLVQESLKEHESEIEKSLSSTSPS